MVLHNNGKVIKTPDICMLNKQLLYMYTKTSIVSERREIVMFPVQRLD